MAIILLSSPDAVEVTPARLAAPLIAFMAQQVVAERGVAAEVVAGTAIWSVGSGDRDTLDHGVAPATDDPSWLVQAGHFHTWLQMEGGLVDFAARHLRAKFEAAHRDDPFSTPPGRWRAFPDALVHPAGAPMPDPVRDRGGGLRLPRGGPAAHAGGSPSPRRPARGSQGRAPRRTGRLGRGRGRRPRLAGRADRPAPSDPVGSTPAGVSTLPFPSPEERRPHAHRLARAQELPETLPLTARDLDVVGAEADWRARAAVASRMRASPETGERCEEASALAEGKAASEVIAFAAKRVLAEQGVLATLVAGTAHWVLRVEDGGGGAVRTGISWEPVLKHDGHTWLDVEGHLVDFSTRYVRVVAAEAAASPDWRCVLPDVIVYPAEAPGPDPDMPPDTPYFYASGDPGSLERNRRELSSLLAHLEGAEAACGG